MVVFVRDKRDGHVTRYPLMGNMSVDGEFITLVKDPRVSRTTTMVKLRTAQYEVIRTTEEKLETSRVVNSWVKDVTQAAKYNYMVFEEV